MSVVSAPPDIAPPSRLRDLRYRIEYGLLRSVAGLVRLLPLDVAVKTSAVTWRALGPLLSPRRHARAMANLAIAFPDKTPEERLAIARASWANLGRVMAETMQIDRLIADPDRIEIASQHVFQRYRNKLGPLIGVSLHMGNWELAIWPLALAGANPAAVYRTVSNPYVDAYVRRLRRDLYPGGLFGRGRIEGDHGESQKTARRITDHVRRGGRLGVICDLYDPFGLRVPFFGTDAPSQAIAAIIARRVGARVWMARCVRIGTESRFRIEMLELKIPRTSNPSSDVREAVADMQRQFETWVREVPDQWMWSNRRWS